MNHMLADNYAKAHWYAMKRNWRVGRGPRDWRYVDDVERLRGAGTADALFVIPAKGQTEALEYAEARGLQIVTVK